MWIDGLPAAGYEPAMLRRSAIVLGASMFLVACAPSAPESESHDATARSDEALAEANLTFTSDWAESVDGLLVEGGLVHLDFDEARIPDCKGTQGGTPQYAITAHARSESGDVQSVVVAGLNADSDPTLELDEAGDLEIWFEATNRWGCRAWDSNLGDNYVFRVIDDPAKPDWIGNAAVVTARQTCDGGPCESTRRSLDQPFLFDSGTRQRAAIAALYFDVWEPGVTDFDNADLWRQLDSQIHLRWGGQEGFETRYADISGRNGNDARYSVSLRALDPFRYPPVDAAGCPSGTMTLNPDGHYARATMEFYFTVNGKELRPSGGGTYRGHFDGPASAYPGCVVP
jgi:hypothetical protein